MRSSIKVSRVNVLVIERSICQFYDALYYYLDYLYKTDLNELKNIDTKEILRILMEGKEIWTYWKGTAVPETFNQALMMPKTKMWMEFVCSKNWPTTNVSDINAIHAIITYGILQKNK
ncbi:hypothetical protein Gotur_033778, partial [Gossypium turneri]